MPGSLGGGPGLVGVLGGSGFRVSSSSSKLSPLLGDSYTAPEEGIFG